MRQVTKNYLRDLCEDEYSNIRDEGFSEHTWFVSKCRKLDEILVSAGFQPKFEKYAKKDIGVYGGSECDCSACR